MNLVDTTVVLDWVGSVLFIIISYTQETVIKNVTSTKIDQFVKYEYTSDPECYNDGVKCVVVI